MAPSRRFLARSRSARSSILKGHARLGERRAHQRHRHQRCRVRPARAAAPVEEAQPAVAPAFLGQEVHRDPRRVIGVVGLLEVVEGPAGEHHTDDCLAVARAGDAAGRALRVGPAADQRAVADAPRELAREAARGGRGGDRAVPVQGDGAHGSLRRRPQPARTATRTPARSSSRPSTGSAPAPPWTMMDGTRGAGTRSRCGGMALTVSQSGRIAKRSRAALSRDRAMSRLPPARRPSRSRRGVAAAPVCGPRLLGAAAAGLRRPEGAPPPRRARTRGARRQPHRPDVHGRPERRLARRRAPPRGLRQPADLATSGRRSPPPRRVHHRRAPLRAARQQADAGRARALRAVPSRGARAVGSRERRRGARADRLAGVPACPPPARRAPATARPALRARRRGDLRRWRRADRLVPPEPAEHVHRQAHAADAPRRVPQGAPTPGGTLVKASLYHLQLNVSNPQRSIPFYQALLEYFEYRVLAAAHDFMGMSNGTADFWIIATPDQHRQPALHRKRSGLNHLAFGVASRDAADVFHREFLVARWIPTLYGSPRDYPAYAAGYYAVFFEDPDRLKLEVAHVPGPTGEGTSRRGARRKPPRGS